ncbi:hypothetical protein [Actinopolyspora erythraea]|uniref:hypothetical protein n=1 Tax=Actinopolyspora erythraea TaxID=414996 RepID=UPI0018E0642D|nr:hypothetical protein [Actinopolyspora erythraea]
MIKLKRTSIAVGLLLVTSFAAPTGTALAEEQTKGKQGAGSTGELKLLSEEQYELYKDKMESKINIGLSKKEASSAVISEYELGSSEETNNSSGNSAKATDPWNIMDSPSDRNGHTNPIRYGWKGNGPNCDGGFGYAKYSVKHNINSVDLVAKTVRRGTPHYHSHPRGPRFIGHIVGEAPNGVYIDEKIIVGSNRDTYSYCMQSNSPDGLRVGVITAYCEGKKLCPSEVNRI